MKIFLILQWVVLAAMLVLIPMFYFQITGYQDLAWKYIGTPLCQQYIDKQDAPILNMRIVGIGGIVCNFLLRLIYHYTKPRWRRIRTSIFTMLLICIVIPAGAQAIRGRVISVHDGDTFKMIIEHDVYGKHSRKLYAKGETIAIRLYGIDCPELGQPYATVARDSMRSWLLGKEVDVLGKMRSSYGRVVGQVLLAHSDWEFFSPVHQLLLEGLAKQDTRFDTSAVYRFCENKAKERMAGIWGK